MGYEHFEDRRVVDRGLPAFTRHDAAAFLGLGRDVRARLNVENLFDVRYYSTSQGNNNVMPGATRTVRVTLSTGM